MLKSPVRSSGDGIEHIRQVFFRAVQNEGCSARAFGAYVLIMERVSPFFQVIETWMARPGMRTVEVVASRWISSLLMTIVTPAEPPGQSGLGEWETWSRFMKRESICMVCWSER